MPQISKTLTTEPKTNILCYHYNSSNQIQIIQFVKSNIEYSSKIIFPGQRIMFEAEPDSQIEILLNGKGDTSFSRLVNCQDLQVNSQF
ncbi:DUF1830 domain-containing protein [Pleurocapsa sp. PCC 7319]|uniref:DUF1830 domain-containing protein n=1 Tax=Pleurocapsa sp. PCC 7319 TaxID=118161 RepID=UPI000382159D|nr:DUF1830 domain-containing protein [Pleurocapsa sp. PCC 7319]